MTKGHPTKILRVIASYKFAKALLVLLTGFGLLNLLHPLFTAKLYAFLESLPLAFATQSLREGLDYLTSLSPIRLRWFSAVSFLYAVLFSIEGIGLWAGWRWAEWLTVLLTGSLIPLEIYELITGANWTKWVVFMGNIAIVAYLILLIRRERVSDL